MDNSHKWRRNIKDSGVYANNLKGMNRSELRGSTDSASTEMNGSANEATSVIKIRHLVMGMRECHHFSTSIAILLQVGCLSISYKQ